MVVTGPLLGPGYLLLRDAVSTPRSYLTDAALGLTDAAPRALPQDFAIALASHVLDGGIVVKALLVLGLTLAGWGSARLVAQLLPDIAFGGRLVAATLAIWNPYVAERLLQGHWSLLVGYGCLPWVAAAALAQRRWALVFWIALAGLTPTGVLLAAVTALACARRWGTAAAALAATVVTALPWLVATVVSASLSSTAGAGVDAFAARAEPGLGTLGSLAGLAGIWNAQAVPDSRTTIFAVTATLVLVAVVAVGAPAAVASPLARPLLVLAAVAVLVPAALATGPGQAVLAWASGQLPGLGVLRDGQKWVALALPGYALAAAGVARLGRSVAVVSGVALIAVLPDLAWGVGGQLRAVHYPQAWPAVAALINADPRPVAVLPLDSMRQFDWAGSAPVLDPLPRWVSADVLVSGDLLIGGRIIPGEGAHGRAVTQLVLDGAPQRELADAGVGWVVVEGSGAPLDLPVVYRDADLALYDVGGSTSPADGRGLLIGAHLVWLASLFGAGVTAALRRRR
ncbi:membrane protein [Mycolicibacterium neoaurum]|nr:membrane protein [Mycolicibacterium neoaurum VKM Ac-1815D]AXK78661.1 hypothetical protein DXK33_22265 [Mycolicibacterium neoaurum]KJQ49001.1 membrane protein [Mycolicibacterium neoaurum]KUM07554.1 hypothetical protein AVZ31_16265 [Mycolicibacterium neoaurum]